MAQLLRKKSNHAGVGTGEYRSEKLLNFVSALIAPEDGALRKIRLETPKRGLPPINIGPDEGKILDFLVKACRAQNAVEVGTLAGYSSCWIARALPEGGMLHTLEYEAKHAQLARDNIRAAGLESKITVHEGDASVILSSLVKSGPYDFCFIDADKVNYPRYLRWAIDNVRSGGIVVGDNAYLFGKLHLSAKKAKNDGPAVEAMQEFLSTMADTRFFSSCAMIPTGEGMAMAVMK